MISDTGSQKISSVFEAEGYTVYNVGGCVRDSIMGRPVSDYDIATPTRPELTEEILEKNGIRYVETGLKHGTVTAIIDGKPYEITTFRTDGNYSDNRRPDSVEFVTDITKDLSRRDFTVNAMAYSDKDGITDPFSGRADIENRVIRAVGDPDTRFNEDALRILRALRFASVLDFDIEQNTADSVIKNAKLLANVSRERITSEITKLITGKSFFKIFCKFKEVFLLIFPECDKIYEKNALSDFETALGKLPKNADEIMALMLYFITKSDPDEKYGLEAFAKNLVLSNSSKTRIQNMLGGAEIQITPNDRLIRLMLYKYGLNATRDMLIFNNIFSDTSSAKAELDKILKENRPYNITHLNIDGNALKKLGIKGADIKDTLNKLLLLVINGEVKNTEKELLNKIKQL